jgi:hypothetical protein
VGKVTIPNRSKASSVPQRGVGNRGLTIGLCSLIVLVAIVVCVVIYLGANHRQQTPTAAAKPEVHEIDIGAAERTADAIFDAAKTTFNSGASFQAGVVLLRQYIANPHATKKAEAEQLLAEYDLATSDEAAVKTLMAMSDDEFIQFQISGKVNDGKITRGSFKSGSFVSDVARKLRSKAGERSHSHVIDAFLLAQRGPQLEGVQDGTQTATH